jgi:hypothetical protein
MEKPNQDHSFQEGVERKNSIVLQQSLPAEATALTSWLERKLKPTKYTPRYPFVGKPLLWMTCAFGSLGDALFGYDSGKIKHWLSLNDVT